MGCEKMIPEIPFSSAIDSSSASGIVESGSRERKRGSSRPRGVIQTRSGCFVKKDKLLIRVMEFRPSLIGTAGYGAVCPVVREPRLT